ncbi:DUF6966 domain-containing protein [Halocynthiibacter sp.]|uniref:DUF6966 domain-containing protein n=1 Tax=Halocynthiibacter sp. TaxID=1979210 RepID=UPI003C3863F1
MGDILSELGNEFWAAKIYKIGKIAQNSDAACAKQFLGCLGGMGSLNDYIWCAGSDRLFKLLDRGYASAKSLQR